MSEKKDPIEITLTNFETCCRLCLASNAANTFWDITNCYLASDHRVCFIDAIKSIANVEIVIHEQQSRLICGSCSSRLDEAYSFIKDIRRNNATVEEFFKDTTGDLLDDELAPGTSVPEFAFMDDGEERALSASSESDNESVETVKHHTANSPPKPITAVDVVLRNILPGTLARRERRKTGQRSRYPCTRCDKTFNRKSNLIDHERLHDQVKLYECEYCGKSFVQVGNLRMHLRTHTAEKPYSCHLCQKAFAQSSSLKMHLKAHANIRPHACEICDKSFLSKSDLNKHKLSHSRHKGFQCVLCKTQFFTQKVHLRVHLKRHHPSDDLEQLLQQGIVTNK